MSRSALHIIIARVLALSAPLAMMACCSEAIATLRFPVDGGGAIDDAACAAACTQALFVQQHHSTADDVRSCALADGGDAVCEVDVCTQ